MESTLRLFKGLPIDDREMVPIFDEDLAKRTAAKGFIFDAQICVNYKDYNRIIELVDKAYGRDGEELNQSFHKSWAKVRDASIEQLVMEQIIHYLTTYGFEQQGIYSEESVYIPREQLDVPQLEDGVRLVVIRGFTKAELTDKLMDLLSSGIALHEKTIDDVLDVATFVEFSEDRIDEVKNKEVKSALYDYFGIVPENPTEFLRYVVYRATNKTLLIKNAALVSEIKGRDNLDIARYFDLYEKEFGLARLAEIFYRFKPVFLAFRSNTRLKRTINKIRRLAVANHKPMQEDLLNSITARLSRGEGVQLVEVQKELDRVNTFRKIRLAYALRFRTTDADSILYRVRNGKSYAKEFNFTDKFSAKTVFNVVRKSIIDDVAKNVAGKKIYIPEGVKYALPATEKQFTGNLPSGSFVDLAENDLLAGIHWKNVGRNRIDLDLSIQNAEGKIGWDGAYRNGSNDVHFSGDVTDAPAPKGASEIFRFSNTARGIWIMFVNYYNFNSEVEVPFKIIVAQQDHSGIEKNHTLDPNGILAQASSDMKVKQKALGIIVADATGRKFYFAESDLGKSISVRGQAYAEQARKFLLNYYTDTIILNDILADAGAEFVEDVAEADIDLTPEAIDKTSILQLLKEDNSGSEAKTD